MPPRRRTDKQARKKDALRGSFATGALRKAAQKRVVDPRIIEGAPVIKEAPPLLLLPMRLEYRIMEPRTPPRIIDSLGELAQKPLRAGTRGDVISVSGKAAEAYRREIAQLRRKAAAPAVAALAKTEIWFRWYPDEGFAERGIAPGSDDELAALAAFDEKAGAHHWWMVEQADVAAAWQALAAAVGPARAIHLLRTRGEPPSADTTLSRAGRVAALPRRVALFAIDRNGGVSALAEGAQIPQPSGTQPGVVSYTPAALDPGGWLNSFETAIQVGMGVKVSDEALVNHAMNAEWIVAVGLYSAKATDELRSLLQDGIANGNFAFLEQDTPTNSAPGIRSVHLNPYADLLGFVTAATQRERGTLDASTSCDADLFGRALGLQPAELRTAINAGNEAFEDARAMLRVIGPTLLDGAPDGVGPLQGIDEDEFIEALAGNVSARGPLPAVRFGRNPFGVLPVTRLADFVPVGEGGSIRYRVHDFLRRYAESVGAVQARHALGAITTLAPDDPQASEKLAEILQQNPVSRRIDVGDVGKDTVEPLGCPYVSNAAHPADVYLRALRTTPLQDLPDPLSNDRSWPLLYRLARMTLVRNTEMLAFKAERVSQAKREKRDESAARRFTMRQLEEIPVAVRLATPAAALRALSVTDIMMLSRRPVGIAVEMFSRLRTVNADFAAALQRLEAIATRPQGIAQLETLLMETVDVFQSRVDAFATGLAYSMLVARQAQRPELRAGYYGFLNRLRPPQAGDAGDGYIQAPTLAQATTAAILRSAHRRHRGDGAFAIDLPSRRVRRALSVLRLQRQGLSLSEALGLRGERWLSDRKNGLLQLKVREQFPITNPLPPESARGTVNAQAEPVRVRLFDGLAFLASTLAGFSAPERALLDLLKVELNDDLDALSDLVMCEAVHLRAIGQIEAANAWLQVLSGESVPGEPTFLRTQRHGQGSSHRVSVLLPFVAASAAAPPREIADPSLAAFAARSVGLDRVALQVTVTRTNVGAFARAISPSQDLGMTSMDLVVGGESELRMRLRHHLLVTWMTDAAMINALGALPATAVRTFADREVAIAFDPAVGVNPLAPALAAAARVRALAQRGRALEPADLSAAASPDHPLTEAVEVELTHESVSELAARASALSTRFARELDEFRLAYQSFLTRARESRRLMDIQADDATLQSAIGLTELGRRSFVASAVAISRYCEPDALQVITGDEAIADPEPLAETLAAMDERLVAKLGGLDAAMASIAAAAQTRSEIRLQQQALVAALQGALDGEALPVLPSIPRVDATDPLLDAPQAPAAALGVWAQKREGVARALGAVAGLNGIEAHPVSTAATDDESAEDADTRVEEEAPRAYHFGTFIGDAATITTALGIVGIVADEWVSQRPSRTQAAALAINRDSPQTEPPHCLLLCVPPKAGVLSWSNERAVGMVGEVIQLMLGRALTTDDKPTPGALLPNANQVAFAAAGNVHARRVPTGKFVLFPGQREIAAMVRVQGQLGAALGAAGVGLHEIAGHHQLEE